MADDPNIRLRPRRPRFVKEESKSWSQAFKGLMRLKRMTSSRSGSPDKPSKSNRTAKPHKQRCAVRLTYSPNQVRGQWAAHGRYLARESANEQGVGFGARTESVEIASSLAAWQRAGDTRMFKMIVSPEFGERLDLEAHTRQLLSRIGSDLGFELEWVAIAHYNTGHPHVHVAIRGVTGGQTFRMPRDLVKHGLRRRAEDICTEQLGFRTIADAIESGRRQIDAQHVTELDRRLARLMEPTTGDWAQVRLEEPKGGELQRTHMAHMQARLGVLASMDLARRENASGWLLRAEFQTELKALQRANDRQRSLIQETARLDSPKTLGASSKNR